MAQQGLKAGIAAVTIFDEVVAFPAEVPGYFGQPLYISAIELDGTNLVFTIDDAGPPANAPAPMNPAPTAAYVMLSLDGSTAIRSGTTQQKFTYSGGPVTISAMLMVGTDLDYDVQPVIAAFTSDSDAEDVVSMYVIVSPFGQVPQLRWIKPGVSLAAVPNTVRVIPAASGSSSLGPFGIQTP